MKRVLRQNAAEAAGGVVMEAGAAEAGDAAATEAVAGGAAIVGIAATAAIAGR